MRHGLTPFALFVLCVPILTCRADSLLQPPTDKWTWHLADGAAELAFRRMPLVETVPENLTIDIAFRGRKQRFGQWRYGSPDSTRVVVVLDEIERGRFDLYVDRNRNRIIESRDLVNGRGRERQFRLPVETVRGDVVQHEPREVSLKVGFTGRSFSVATSGYFEGHVQLSGQTLRVRRYDGNANGYFADSADRVWIDFDRDSRWDPFGERFTMTPVLNRDGRRIAIRGDQFGKKLTLRSIEGTGQVRLQFASLKPDARVTRVEAMLSSEDGSAIAVNSVENAVTLPPGKYSVGTINISLLDEHDKLWTFVFYRAGISKLQSFELKAGETKDVDPIGRLRFEVALDEDQKTLKPGTSARIQPRLFTAGGLLINCCYQGKERPADFYGGNQAGVSLRKSGRVVASSQSGFA